MIRYWCCGTPITCPHIHGCIFEPREDTPIDYDGLCRIIPEPQPEPVEDEQEATAAELFEQMLNAMASANWVRALEIHESFTAQLAKEVVEVLHPLLQFAFRN